MWSTGLGINEPLSDCSLVFLVGLVAAELQLHAPGELLSSIPLRAIPVGLAKQEFVMRRVPNDFGEACVFALEKWQQRTDSLYLLNVGRGLNLTIREFADPVASATGFRGHILCHVSLPIFQL